MTPVRSRKNVIRATIEHTSRGMPLDGGGDHFIALSMEDIPYSSRSSKSLIQTRFLEDLRPCFFGTKLTPLLEGDDKKGQ